MHNISRHLLRSATKCRQYYTVGITNDPIKNMEMKLKLSKHLQAKIKLTGPITIAEYMREVLTNPVAGYYMHSDVIGNDGDFITSPELGQLFGEMAAIWLLFEWKKIGSPKPFQIIEMGPGHGSLCQDILRVFKHFNELTDGSVHLVEMSPYFCEMQARKLCLSAKSVQGALHYHEGETTAGIPVYWYQKLEDVPQHFSLYVAHEFFDALPIQKFQRTKNGWREILIDIDEQHVNKFKYVLANNKTVASEFFISPDEKRDHIEISRDSILLMKQLATRLEKDGGFALIGDYGHAGEGTDTFRAFKHHKQHDPLDTPGIADLTADVDFHLLKSIATTDDKTIAFGPVQQGNFLRAIGLQERLNQLLKHADPKQEKALKFAADMMTNNQLMGKRFKLLSLFPYVLKDHLTKFSVLGFNT